MQFEDQLFLIQTRGLAADAVYQLAGGCDQDRECREPTDLDTAAGRQRVLLGLRAAGLTPGREVAWPARSAVRRLGVLLVRAGIRLIWLGGAGYPARLAELLGAAAPRWLWLAGAEGRLAGPACAVIGSRQTAQPFLDAARRLGRALADAGVVVVSGMAAGADTAAHEGARSGCAGTLAIPAMGLLNAMRNAECGMRNEESRVGYPQSDPHSSLQFQISNFKFQNQTWLGLDSPGDPFSAGLAIRRNDVIAAMGDALVLVASGLKGGSSYGVRWALRHGVPLFCFEAGAATPPANASLLRAGLARPLGLGEDEEVWTERIVTEVNKKRAAGKKHPGSPEQLSLLSP